jgi:GT2 family glycosyltransferase
VTLVDVVVVSYNSRRSLRDCVAPLAGVDGIRVIVVDNASPDRSLEAVDGLDVETIQQSANHGFSHACNVGWRAGSAPYVLFLNPDTTIEPAAVRSLAEAMDRSPACGAVAPRILGPRGTLEFSQRRFPRLRSTFAQALFVHRLFPRSAWADELIRTPASYQVEAAPEWVSGACVLVRRNVLEEIEGFDEGFFMYCEDIDLCKRIRELPLEVAFVPVATVVHAGGGSAPRSELTPVLARSRVRFARKHESRAVAAAHRLGVGLGELTRVAVSRGGIASRAGHWRAFLAVCSRQPELDGRPAAEDSTVGGAGGSNHR